MSMFFGHCVLHRDLIIVLKNVYREVIVVFVVTMERTFMQEEKTDMSQIRPKLNHSHKYLHVHKEPF